jgi:hypothetical protein
MAFEDAVHGTIGFAVGYSFDHLLLVLTVGALQSAERSIFDQKEFVKHQPEHNFDQNTWPKQF